MSTRQTPHRKGERGREPFKLFKKEENKHQGDLFLTEGSSGIFGLKHPHTRKLEDHRRYWLGGKVWGFSFLLPCPCMGCFVKSTKTWSFRLWGLSHGQSITPSISLLRLYNDEVLPFPFTFVHESHKHEVFPFLFYFVRAHIFFLSHFALGGSKKLRSFRFVWEERF